jgi:hypothetical protein
MSHYTDGSAQNILTTTLCRSRFSTNHEPCQSDCNFSIQHSSQSRTLGQHRGSQIGLVDLQGRLLLRAVVLQASDGDKGRGHGLLCVTAVGDLSQHQASQLGLQPTALLYGLPLLLVCLQ